MWKKYFVKFYSDERSSEQYMIRPWLRRSCNRKIMLLTYFLHFRKISIYFGTNTWTTN